MSDLVVKVVIFGALIPSVVLHELAHGVVANAFGDDTAKRAGRLTLNPLRHIDPFGSVILPALLALSSLGAFGYARPVPVNPALMRSPRNHSLLVSLAGPGTNIALALLAALVYRVSSGDVQELSLYVGYVNVVLAAFNLLPVPPLDGSALIERVLPYRWWPAWLSFRRYSFGLVLIVVFMLPGVLSRVFRSAFDLWVGLL